MSSLILYLLEANGLLAILYALYWLLLRKETFFSFNRFFLLAIMASSLLIPLLSFDLFPSAHSVISKPMGELRDMRISYYDAFEAWSHKAAYPSPITEHTDDPLGKEKADTQPWLLSLTLMLYCIGLVAVIFRLIGSYRWIQRLKSSSQQEVIQGIRVVKVPHPIAPFSFLNLVFVHEDTMPNEDFDQILAHEKTHIREGHSLDLLFVQLAAAGLWFNPVVWQLIKSLKTTHEYIADKNTINQGYSLVTYQTLLLRQLISTNSYGLIHNFNLSFIKKRITMMNIEKSGWAGRAKVALALSTVLVFSLVLVQCNSKNDEQILRESQASSEGIDVPVLPESGFKFKGDPATAVTLSVDDNQITLDGEKVEIGDIAPTLKSESGEHDVIIFRIDRTQPMSLVREVQNEVRKADRLKILYLGQTSDGKPVDVAIMLPPLPGSRSGMTQPKLDDKFVRENNLNLYKVTTDEKAGPAKQQKVYDFVKDQVAEQKKNYVISARFSDDDTFNQYLAEVYHLQQAFYQLYEERSQEMYGESYWDLFEIKDTSEKYAEMYDAVKQDMPMNISIAED
ncbi:MAG: M56 family metallopeptidase [Cyclobacteriaceae bacterium]